MSDGCDAGHLGEMGLDYYLTASEKVHREGCRGETFLFERASLIGACMLRYFSSRLTAEYGDGDLYGDCPSYRMTLATWDEFTGLLEEKGRETEYLAGFVLSVCPFDDEVPEEYRDLGRLDRQAALRYDRWFSSVFGFPAVYAAEGKVIELKEENLQRIIDRAFALYRWMPVCAEVREYLLDGGYTVRLGRG